MSKRAWKLLVAVIGLAFIIAIVITWSLGLLNSSGSLRDDFKTGFVASLWEDLVFFLTAGLGVLAVQMISQRPSEFRSRMEAIFGKSVEYTDSLHSHIEEKFRDLLSYFEKMTIELNILEFSDDRKYVNVILTRRLVVGNLSKDTLSTHTLQVKLAPHGGRRLGFPYVYAIETAEISDPEINEPASRAPIFAAQTISQKIDEDCEQFKIPCGKFRWYKYSVKSWEDIGSDPEIYEIKNTRYVRHAVVKFKNNTDISCSFMVTTAGGSTTVPVGKMSEVEYIPAIIDNRSPETIGFTILDLK